MVKFRIWPASAAIAILATTAIASASPTPNDTGSLRPVSPIRQPATLVRHPVPVAPRPVAVRRVNRDVSDDALLARINRINRENCALVMRERADIDPAILAGIIEQRRAACMRTRFRPTPFNPGFRRDADDRRGDGDDRHVGNGRFVDTDGQRISPARFDDRRDDRQINRLRAGDRRDDRQISRLRSDSRPARFPTASRFQSDRRFAATRRPAMNRSGRPMRRPRP